MPIQRMESIVKKKTKKVKKTKEPPIGKRRVDQIHNSIYEQAVEDCVSDKGFDITQAFWNLSGVMAVIVLDLLEHIEELEGTKK